MKESINPYYSFPRPEVQALVPLTARTLLDIGCGAGALGEGIKRRQICEVYGIEPVPEAAGIAKTLLDHVFSGTIETCLPHLPSQYFDCIVMADVLEHLVDPEAVLSLVKPLLTLDGCIVLSLPNIRHWTTIKMLLEGDWTYDDAGIMDRTHLRFFTLSSAQQMIRTCGYEISAIQAVATSNTPFPTGLDRAIAGFGIDTRTLAKESQIYQFLIVATGA